MNSHNGHGARICEFGVVHSRCRCIHGADQHVWIQCPTPAECKEETGIDPSYAPKHRREVRRPGETRID